MKRIILIILGMLWISEIAQAEFRALLVGINYQNADPQIKRLSGCINDVKDMRDYMIQMGISESSIRILTEEHATRKEIIANFKSWLIDGTCAGDTVFFQYSGHGHQLPDPFGFQYHDPVKINDTEQMKLAEALVPYDAVINANNHSLKNLIIDSEFRFLLSALKDRKVCLFLDCCHSEGISRDFKEIKAKSRYLEVPWDISKSRFEIPDDFPKQAQNTDVRGIFCISSYNPDYAMFAAVRYFQSAYEYPLSCGKNGVFTFSVLKLLRANTDKKLSNEQIMNYACKFIHHNIRIPKGVQEPVFHGPKGSESEPFILLTQSSASNTVSPKPPEISPKPPEISETEKIKVWVTGQDGELLNQIETAVNKTDFCIIDKQHPDIIVDIGNAEAQIYNAVGVRLKIIHFTSDTSDNIRMILKSLEGIYIVNELALLENPSAPFTVEMWIDKPGKTQFKTGDKVTLYYKIKELPQQSNAWLTLINVAPDGTVSILYPQKADFHQGPGEKLFLNAKVIPGKIYSIPKTQADLKQGQNVAIDLRIKLQEGQEYFKAIVTSEPIDWDRMNIGEFRSQFKGREAKGFVVEAAEQTQSASFWSSGDLKVEVEQ